MEEEKKSVFAKVYEDTSLFNDQIVKDNDILATVLALMAEGNGNVELKKRYMLRSIDEAWISAIEDSLPSLDVIIRTPSKYIEEIEEVLPIELARNISPRSLQHLSQHTNFIQDIDGDNVTPSKILNVYREETMQTYENRFVNTLINRLFTFVNTRYEIAKRYGQDEKDTTLEFKNEFKHDSAHVKMSLKIEMTENATDDEKVERNYVYSSALWHRLEKLNDIMVTYINSSFCQMMGKTFIRPPVMRTNAILKNKNLRQCLELWRFIEGYENAGYSMIIQENLEDIDSDYLKEIYDALALQYALFRYHIKNEFESDKELASEITKNVLNPRIVSELNGFDPDEFNHKTEGSTLDEERVISSVERLRYQTLTPDDLLILEELGVSIEAAKIIRKNEEEYLFSNASIVDPGLFDSEEEEPHDDEETQY